MESLAARLQTGYGMQAQRDLPFFQKPGAVRHSLTLIEEMKALRDNQGPLSLALGGDGGHGANSIDGASTAGSANSTDSADMLDWGGLLERAAKGGRLEGEELLAVLNTQKVALQARNAFVNQAEAPALAQLAEALHEEKALCDLLGKAFTASGELNDRTYPTLAKLRAELTRRREAIHAHLERLLRSRGLADALQDELYTLRGRRYVLPIKADFKGQLAGIVHDVSASGATLFIEPQVVVEETNALTLAERKLEMEQDRILRELTASVGQSSPNLRENLGWLGRADLLHAQAALSEAYQGSAPQVEMEGHLELKSVAHPLMLLEAHDPSLGGAHGKIAEKPPHGANIPAREKIVRNDIELGGEQRCMVISGANTGGKTVLLKTLGLCALLVRCGMHIPAAPGSRLDLFTGLWADIGDQQSLESDLSTFSAQIRMLADMLPAVDHNALVLLDEMLTGTEPSQGTALAGEVLKALVNKGPVVVVTTHFSELKLLAETHSEVINASVTFDPRHLRPTYRLQTGLPGASYGLHIARRYGLPDDLVDQAEAGLAQRPAAMDAVLISLQAKDQQLRETALELEQQEAELDLARKALRKEREDLATREKAVRQQEKGAIGREIQSAREQIAGVIRELQQANSLSTVANVRQKLEAVAQQTLHPQQPHAHPDTEHPSDVGEPIPDLIALLPGSEVYVASTGNTGELEAVLNDGTRARVRLGLMTMEFEAGELTHPPPHMLSRSGKSNKMKRGPNGGAQKEKHGQKAAKAVWAGEAGAEPTLALGMKVPPALPREDNTLDLRGHRLHDAMEEVDAFFDLCVVKHINPVVIIHGHGTGALKSGLRTKLRDNPYVEAFRAGDKTEGADGVTVVALNL